MMIGQAGARLRGALAFVALACNRDRRHKAEAHGDRQNCSFRRF
jgi:hypothetical protein